MERIPEIEVELERRIESLTMELVECEWAGSERRPIIRIRIDFPPAEEDRRVSVEDCARVSRELEPWLDDHPDLSERYVLEVSSPGVERPLHRRRDWLRYVGEEVRIQGHEALVEGGKRVDGTLVGVEDEGPGADEFSVFLRVAGGSEIRISRRAIQRAHLIFRWE